MVDVLTYATSPIERLSDETPKKFFLRRLEEKNIPCINPDYFADYMLKKGAPEGLLETIADNLTYLDRETFSRKINQLAHVARGIVNDGDYVAGFWETDLSRHSNYYVYNQLVEAGLGNASRLISPPRGDLNNLTSPLTSPILLPDDCSLSGIQMMGIINKFLGRVENKELIHPLLVTCSKESYDEMRKLGITPEVILPLIADTGAIFNEKQIKFLLGLYPTESPSQSDNFSSIKRLIKKNPPHVATDMFDGTRGQGAYLYMSWYQIPDNMPGFLTGKTHAPRLLKNPKYKPYGF